MKINNREAIQCVVTCLNDVSRFISNGYVWREEDGYPTYEFSLGTLSKFMVFYSKYGTTNKSVVFNLNKDILIQIGDLSYAMAKKLENIEIMDISKKYLSVVLEYYSIVSLIEDVVRYLTKVLNKSKIQVWLSKSKSSYSMYINPDVILKSIRISDHISKDHTRCFNVICCKEIPEGNPKHISKDSTTVYVTKDTYMDVVDEIVGILNTSKEVLLKEKGRIQYNKMQSGAKVKLQERFKGLKRINKYSDY